jgi:hypothetical protein
MIKANLGAREDPAGDEDLKQSNKTKGQFSDSPTRLSVVVIKFNLFFMGPFSRKPHFHYGLEFPALILRQPNYLPLNGVGFIGAINQA